MIVFLRGEVFSKGSMYLDIDVQGVGYRVWVTENLADGSAIQENIFIYTYQHVREDAVVLYGFSSETDRMLFEKLLTVSGIGPKVALQMMNAVDAADFIEAVHREDLHALCELPGIGKKTAQRLIVELKDKLDLIPNIHVQKSRPVSPSHSDKREPSVLTDVVEALKMLGYPERSAFEVAHRVLYESPELNLEDALKMCLQELYVHSSIRR
jgi:holliday junction DNA helicase RuvA